MTSPCCQSRNFGGTPAKTGSRSNSAAEMISAEPARGGAFIFETGLKVMAVVGQETMHSPHCTQLDSPIGSFKSKPIPAVFPFPVRPMTWFSITLSQARTQRSHRMQAL